LRGHQVIKLDSKVGKNKSDVLLVTMEGSSCIVGVAFKNVHSQFGMLKNIHSLPDIYSVSSSVNKVEFYPHMVSINRLVMVGGVITRNVSLIWYV